MNHQRRIPTIDDLIALPTPDDAQIAPNGRHVAYTVQTPVWERDEHVAQLWLVDAAGGEPRQLTFAEQSSKSPRWSPDGRWLAFLSRRAEDEHKQVYRISPFGGEAQRLTELSTNVETLAWAPDGRAIALIAAQPASEADEERRRHYGYYHVENEDYAYWQLWLVQLAGENDGRENKAPVEQLTTGHAFHVTKLAWSPQGDRIAFEARPTPDIRHLDQSRIYVIDLAALAITPVTEPGCYSPFWSPDGSQLAFTRRGSPSLIAHNQICLAPAGGGEPQVISGAFEEDAMLQGWGPDGIYFCAAQRTDFHLFRIDPHSGEIVRLTPTEPAGWASVACSFDRAYAQAALIAWDSTRYTEVAVLDLQGPKGEVRRLTRLNDRIRDWQLAQREVISWTSSDGVPIEGVLIKPADFDPGRRHPLLVVLHGGPRSASRLALLSYRERRHYPIQQWAAQGALILEPNYRGSIGYGAQFCTLNVRNLGLGDAQDVLSGVEALVERGWADPERVGVMGWSQGGYIAAFLSTYCGERLQAASVGAGISDWVTYYVLTDIHPFTRQYLGATPWEDMEVYRRTSPITYIKGAKAPVLIQHGELDRRVPIANAYKLYQGLQDMGVESKLVVYKDMAHIATQPRFHRQIMEENLAWFDRWIWGRQPQAAAPPCYIALCGAEKRQDAGQLPAIERYAAAHIQSVYRRAQQDGANFRIFSGRFGLLRPADPIPWYDHILQGEEVSDMAAWLAGQLQEQGLRHLIVHTGSPQQDPTLHIYLGCLQVAAGMAGNVTVEHRQVADDAW